MEFKEIETLTQTPKSQRMRFIGLEIFLFSLFMFGYSIVNAIFSLESTSVSELLTSSEYILYSACMFVLLAIFISIWFIAGIYFQIWSVNRMAKKMMVKLLNSSPELKGAHLAKKQAVPLKSLGRSAGNILDTLQNGDFHESNKENS